MTNKPFNLGWHAFSCNLQTGQTYEDCQFKVVDNM